MTPLRDLIQTFGQIGLMSFGGPAAQIALMHRVLVDDRKWLTEKDYLSALSFCMLLPGPEAMQLATWSGWRLRGTLGGLIAGGLFVLPGALVVLALTMVYAAFGGVPAVQALFAGVQAAVAVIVIEALLRVGKRALKGPAALIIAGLAFLALFAFNAPFPLVILLAGAWGFVTARGAKGDLPPRPTLSRTLRTIALWTTIWLAPLALLWLAEGGILAEIGAFFAKLAILTFGGAYAVLAWMAQAVVEEKGWLTLTQMMDGLGLAETTPGPLILVTEFVGYFAGLREMGSIWGGIAAAVVTLWMTFAPCFLWIFAGAPYIEAIGKRPRLSGALAAITAAVVGVILNLSLWFGLHVLFGQVERLEGWFRPWVPAWGNLDWFALTLSVMAAVALLRFHLGIIRTLILCAVIGAAWKLVV